jgi:hypothetical protein
MEIRPVGAELRHADRQTDRQTHMTKLIVAFRNFATAPSKIIWPSRFSGCSFRKERLTPNSTSQLQS